jgi:hypothetical protein
MDEIARQTALLHVPMEVQDVSYESDGPASTELRQRRRLTEDSLRAAAPLRGASCDALAAAPRNLNSGMDCANASRNLREHVSDALGNIWEERRNLVRSEMSLSIGLLLATLCYECLPTLLGGLLCTLREGSTAAKNRGLLPFYGISLSRFPGALLGFLFSELTLTPQMATYCLIAFVCVFREDLPASAPIEVFGMIFLTMVAKGFTVAFKYGFKSDALTSTGEGVNLHTEEYERTDQRERGQMVCYILNLTGDMQKSELISLIYKSSLVANTDLSCASFTWHPLVEQHARAQGPWAPLLSPERQAPNAGQAITHARSETRADSNVAKQLWEGMLDMTKAVEQGKTFAQTDTDYSGDISLAEMQARAKEALGAAYDSEQVRRQFESLDTNGDKCVSAEEMAGRDMDAHGLLMFYAQDGVLSTLLREGEQMLRGRIESGELPASVLALLIVLECSYVPPSVGMRYFVGYMLGPAFVIAIVPLVVRLASGLPLLGNDWQQRAYILSSTWLMAFTAMPILIYFVCPCIWLYRQRLMCQRLLALISSPRDMTFKWSNHAPPAPAPKYDSGSAFGAEDGISGDSRGPIRRGGSARFGTERGVLGDLHLDAILLDLRSHSNVTAWAALWRVLHGSAFAPAVQIKFQFYCTIMSAVFFLSAAIDAVAAVLVPTELSIDFQITSIVRLLLFTCPLIAQTTLALSVNCYPQEYTRALSHALASNAATAAALARPRGVEGQEDTGAAREDLRAELLEANEVIAAVIEEINCAAEVAPMRILFLRAELGIVTIISSSIFAVVGFQLRGFITMIYE